MTAFYSSFSENLVETFSIESSAQPGVTDTTSIISFSVNPASSHSCSHNASIIEASTQRSQGFSSQASTAATVTPTVSSSQPPPFMQLSGPQQISDVPQASVQALSHVTPQHYVALPPTFLQSESDTQTSPQPPPPPISVHPPVAPALTTAAPVPAAVAATTTADGLAAVTQPVPLANNPVANTGPGIATTPATITIASTPNLLQPSLVMSDQNLQWILSSAANSQQNPEQVVSNVST